MRKRQGLVGARRHRAGRTSEGGVLASSEAGRAVRGWLPLGFATRVFQLTGGWDTRCSGRGGCSVDRSYKECRSPLAAPAGGKAVAAVEADGTSSSLATRSLLPTPSFVVWVDALGAVQTCSRCTPAFGKAGAEAGFAIGGAG